MITLLSKDIFQYDISHQGYENESLSTDYQSDKRDISDSRKSDDIIQRYSKLPDVSYIYIVYMKSDPGFLYTPQRKKNKFSIIR